MKKENYFNMAEFKIKKDQISRLKVLNDYIKKMEAFSPLGEKQTFVIDNNQLTVYGTANAAGSGHIEATFDIESTSQDHFGLELSRFITYLEKTKSDTINVLINNKKMTVKSDTSSIVISQALIYDVYDEDALNEIKSYVTDKLSLKEFKNPINVNLSQKELITTLGNMTKLQDTNHQILLGKNSIKSADQLCILDYKSKEEITSEEEILFDRDIVSIIKDVDAFSISSDKKYYYFDINKYGIKLIFVPKKYEWSFPEPEDLVDIKPLESKQITLKINTNHFYDIISEYEKVFDPSTWRFEQIFFKTPTGFNDNPVFDLHFDNMDVEIRNNLTAEIIETTDDTEDFEFLMPTQHFKLLENVLKSEEFFTMKYSSTDVNDPNGVAIVVENSTCEIILAKVIP